MPVSSATLAAFCAASFVLLVIPGPTIIMVVGQALTHGRRVALASVAGVALGDLVAATLSILGVGTLLAASATVFAVVKWAGALYLVYLGMKMWRSPGRVPSAELDALAGSGPHAAIFRQAFVVTMLNPKSIVFFIAFLPQFIRHDAAFAPQAAILVACFVLLGALNAAGYAFAAGSARRFFGRAEVLRRASRTGGTLLIGAGIAAALAQRGS